MSKVDTILKEINSLDPDEIQLIIQKLFREINIQYLLKYKGIGKGVWKQDAQTYINEGRKDTRN